MVEVVKLIGLPKLIDDGIMARVKKAAPRTYLGASGLGEECARKIWYRYKQPKMIENPRVHRIFDMGHIIEDYIVRLLRDAGCTVYTEMPDGEQFGFEDGKLAGHIDGVITGLPESSKPHLFEAKSAKASGWKEFVKKGCQTTNMTYYVQCQIYMQKMKLDRALFVVMNKDTQELYFERIKYVKAMADHYLNRGHEIAAAVEPPDRQYSKSTFF